MSKLFRFALASIWSWLSCGTSATGQLPNVPLPTLGGQQFWTDFAWRNDWRIQHNAVTDHWRVLDPRNIRRGWGSRAGCQATLERLQPLSEVRTEHVIILLHGLFRTSGSMDSMARRFSVETAMTPIRFEYASTRGDLAEHANALEQLIAGLPSNVRIDFVGHSMGNIVLRRAFHDWIANDDQATLQRIEHVVMLGPPNNGAAIARQLSKTGVFALVGGDGAMELGKNWDLVKDKLATPTCPFMIVAGRLDESSIRNPLVDQASDFVVSVEETHLDGAAATLEVNRLHSYLMDDEEVQAAVLEFIAR